MVGRRILAAAAFVAATLAQQLTITNPSPTSWWISGSENTLAWDCNSSPYSSFTVVLANSDPTILAAPLALIANVPNYDCSLTVNQQQSTQPSSASYTLQLTNPVNLTDIYASTQFQIMPFGSPYPASSSPAASGSATGTAGAAASTSTTATSAAAANSIPFGVSMAAALLLGLVVA